MSEEKEKPARMGRPPEYTEEELQDLVKDLYAWMEKCDEENIEVVHLSEFYGKIKGWNWDEWSAWKHRKDFFRHYKQAMEWMGRRLLKNKNLPTSYGNRFLTIYFKEVKAEEYEKMEKEAELRRQDKKDDMKDMAQVFGETLEKQFPKSSE